MSEHKRIGNCSKCGKNAAVNTPHVDDVGNIICYRCAKNYDIYMEGIDQYLHEGEFQYKRCWRYGELIVSMEHGPTFAYMADGFEWFYLKPEEKEMGWKDLLMLMKAMKDKGWHRCSRCGKELKSEKEIGGRPLFAGINCHECWAVHKNELEKERKEGHVCSMCREPHSNCCC